MIPSASNVPEIDVTVETSTFLPITEIEAPLLTSPAEQYLYQVAWNADLSTVIFTWAAATGATDYEIEVSEDSAFASILKVVKVTGGALTATFTAADIQFLYSKQYYWRVRATAGVVSSPWSKIWEFGFNKQTVSDMKGINDYTQAGTVGDSTLEITTDSLPPYTVGTPYGAVISAKGGTPPYTFYVISGGTPVGTSLDGAGAITGTPTSAAFGVYSVLVGVEDDDGNINTREFFIASAEFALGYDPSYQAVVTTGGTPRYPVCPKVAGNLPGATDGDVWFDTGATMTPPAGTVTVMTWVDYLKSFITKYET